MSDKTLLQCPGVLWARAIATTTHALDCGALVSISTAYELLEDQGVKFLVRIFLSMGRKEAAQEQQAKQSVLTGKDFNPFLPYEPDLYVMDISQTHVCILNKFNVVDHHLLIVTREFEEQESLLTLEDFEALWACLAEVDGLGFYNAGAKAGASQRHKHLQLIPLPLSEDGFVLPIESQLQAQQDPTSTEIPALPFVHGFLKLNLDPTTPIEQAAQVLLASYRSLFQQVGCSVEGDRTSPYNLLVTRQWMFLVPRSHEGFEGISLNSLGFAGALLVRNEEQLQQLKAVGPLQLLQNVAIARSKERDRHN